MFLCLPTHSNLIIFLAVEHLHALLFHDQLPVEWGELIRLMFLCIHTHSNLIIFLPVEQRQAQLFHDQLPVGEGKEYKPKNKSPTQRCEEKKHNLMSCVMMFKKKLEEESCYRDTMTKTHNKNVHRRPTV